MKPLRCAVAQGYALTGSAVRWLAGWASMRPCYAPPGERFPVAGGGVWREPPPVQPWKKVAEHWDANGNRIGPA